MKYFYTYKTTNLINGKYYYGKHVAKTIPNKYLGSGTVFLKALKKYGRSNFNKEILQFYTSKEECAIAERILVNENVVNDPRSYNIALGGGGMGYHKPRARNKPLSKESCNNISKGLKAYYKSIGGMEEGRRKNIGDANRGKEDSLEVRKNKSDGKKGITFTKKHCKNISVAITKVHAANRIKLYMEIPDRLCEWCNSIIDIRSKRLDAARRSRFCNKSCSTKFRNKNRGERNNA